MLVSKGCRDSLVFFADLEATGEIREKLKITQIVFELEADYEVKQYYLILWCIYTKKI